MIISPIEISKHEPDQYKDYIIKMKYEIPVFTLHNRISNDYTLNRSLTFEEYTYILITLKIISRFITNQTGDNYELIAYIDIKDHSSSLEVSNSFLITTYGFNCGIPRVLIPIVPWFYENKKMGDIIFNKHDLTFENYEMLANTEVISRYSNIPFSSEDKESNFKQWINFIEVTDKYLSLFYLYKYKDMVNRIFQYHKRKFLNKCIT